jgi:O-acetyl-ADP-ribose deacetylase (regulator of RNase III)
MKRVQIVHGDITTLAVDAIVNAANSSLLGGGGVDGAIHRAGGSLILEECKAIRARDGDCPPGHAVITSGGNLLAKYVIHAVGPVWRGGENEEDVLLASAYRSSLELAKGYRLASIAFPNISTGVYGFPKGRAAEIATKEVRRCIENLPDLKKLIFCCFDEENYRIYKSILDN